MPTTLFAAAVCVLLAAFLLPDVPSLAKDIALVMGGVLGGLGAALVLRGDGSSDDQRPKLEDGDDEERTSEAHIPMIQEALEEREHDEKGE